MTTTAPTTTNNANPARALLQSAAFPVLYSKLYLSAANVRSKKTRTIESVRPLAAMIEADGLLADLHVSEERDARGKPTGRYGVEAGGRRWMAIGLLINEKRLPADIPVSCKLVASERATGVSLAENISIERMHPADEYSAFAKLIVEGQSVEAVATHFGVKEIDVQRRMKLANVAPALVEMYRSDQLSLDQMMALATTDDHKRQLAVWKSLPEYQRSASSIRKRLTDDEVRASDPRVKLIGLARYKASGGTVRTDLFTDDEFLEAGLVDLIAAEVLAEATARVQAEGWAFVEAFETMGYEESQRFQEPPTKYLPECVEVRQERETFEAQLDAAEDRYNKLADSEDDDSDVAEKLEAIDNECNMLRAKIDTLQSARIDTSGYDKSTLGAFVTTESGVLKIKRGVMTAKEAKSQAQRQSAVKRGADPSQAVHSTPEFSEKLMADLTSHRTAAMQAALSTNVPVALALLADHLCSEIFDAGHFGSFVKIDLKESGYDLERNGTAMAESAAAKHLAHQRDTWKSVVPSSGAERLAWLLNQPQESVLALIAFCTASSVDLIARRAEANERADAVADALKLDVADFWSVGVENFLTHVSKAKIAAVVTEARDAQAAAPLGAMKKADACAKAAELLAGTRWLPAPMRLGTAARSADAANGGNAPSSANAA